MNVILLRILPQDTTLITCLLTMSLAKIFFFIIYSVTVERNRASGHLIIKMEKFKQDSNDFSNTKKELQNVENLNDSSNGEY